MTKELTKDETNKLHKQLEVSYFVNKSTQRTRKQNDNEEEEEEEDDEWEEENFNFNALFQKG